QRRLTASTLRNVKLTTFTPLPYAKNVARTSEGNYSPGVASTTPRDEQFRRVALKEEEKALGRTSPNPAVGAVLVVGDRVVARGHHRGAGHEHAEIECLRNFGAKLPARATFYVTLEPCSTFGRTAPCTNAIIKA